MNTYNFTVLVGGLTTNTPNYDGLLYDSGCDDGLVCALDQRIFIEFDREAPNAKTAMTSAIKNIEDAGGYAIAFNEGGPVTLAEASHMAGINDSTMKQYENGELDTSNFPHPIHLGKTAIWSWYSIAKWLVSQNKAPKEVFEVAVTAIELQKTHCRDTL